MAWKEEAVSFSELYDKIKSVAGTLAKMGVEKGQRVVFTAVSAPSSVAVYLGIQYLGAVAVFADKNGTPEGIRGIYEDCRASLLVTDKPMKEFAQGLKIYSMKALYQTVHDGALPYLPPREEDAAEILYTTGSTGKPKGVILSYRAVYHILSNTIKGVGIVETDRVLLPLPLNHSFALRVLRAVLFANAAVVLQNGFTFAKEIENNMQTWQCTAMAAVPASLETVRLQMRDKFAPILGKLRYIEVGAGSLSIAQRTEFTKLLPDTVLYNTWGSSETGGVFFANVTELAKCFPEKIATLGKAAPGVELKVIGGSGEPVIGDRENPGRMALKGDMQMSGYWNNDALTEETLRSGWLLTGDMVYLDKDGYVYMLGRADDIINVGGEKVSPIEVENIAGQYGAVRECACIGVPDPEGVLGQIPVLFVAAKGSDFSEADFQKYLFQRMERYKAPRKLVLLQELPRNRMLKIDRNALRRKWEQGAEESDMNPVMRAILARRSVRKFTDREIEKGKLEMILKAGYHAPSGHNMQSWRFTVLTDREAIDGLKAAVEKAAEKGQSSVYGWENPKVLALISNDRRNPTGCQDAACAAENMFLAAQSYGIGSVWLNPLMTLGEEKPVREFLDKLGVPKNHIVWCAAAFGYPAAEGAPLARKKNVVHFVGGEEK